MMHLNLLNNMNWLILANINKYNFVNALEELFTLDG